MASVVVGQRHGGDDWAEFDHRTFVVRSTDAGGLWVDDGGRLVGIKVLGVKIDRDVWHDLIDRPATVLLSGPQTREGDRLRAYVFVDGRPLAVETVKSGNGSVDRASAGDYRGALYPAQADAKKHHRGLWSTPVMTRAVP